MRTQAHDGVAVAVEVVVVRSTDCHLCEDAIEALDEIGRDYALEVRVVEASSDEGTDLMRRHRFAMMPGVLLDGGSFSSGRLPRKKLRRLLEGRR